MMRILAEKEFMHPTTMEMLVPQEPPMQMEINLMEAVMFMLTERVMFLNAVSLAVQQALLEIIQSMPEILPVM